MQISTSFQLIAMGAEDSQPKASIAHKAPVPTGGSASAAIEGAAGSGSAAEVSAVVSLPDASTDDDAVVADVYRKSMDIYDSERGKQKTELEAANAAADCLWKEVFSLTWSVDRDFDQLQSFCM